jgi:alanyl-tRNA synthetase
MTRKNWTASEIRQSFFDFFKSKGHVIVPSSPVVLPSDPTLLFTNAGMNQFKEIFLGAREATEKRVANTQKCIRVSGKHNDLEEVGIDTYHHTYFEMLGNWSFGDYYKREAIAWAWELLTSVWQLPKERLWVTVFRTDDDAATIWKEVTDINPAHILKFDEKDNFWEMGETGPCGPCSEIHVDLTANGCGPEMVNAGSPEVMEIWNLVFIQYNRRADGQLEELPSKHVDTGMGLERVVNVLQGKKSNYDTDLFQPIIRKIVQMTGKPYEGDAAIAMRVIADHIRTLSLAIGDGVQPSNEGRGYVMRRLLRRAVRYGRKIGFEKPFMGDLLQPVEEILGGIFPELKTHHSQIKRGLQAEEESFAITLDRGIALFEDVAGQIKKAGDTLFPGDAAFKLYDTFGFPLDLTSLMATEQGLAVDQQRFSELMEEQRDRARSARKQNMMNENADLISGLIARGIKSEFTGYSSVQEETKVLEVVSGGKIAASMKEGETGEIILERTPFYSESGGQLGDKGVLRGAAGEFEVWDTQRPAEGLIMHVGKVVSGTISKGEPVAAIIEGDRRSRLIKHHTATHLLQCALKKIVSGTIKQAGSLVAPDRMRFDFNHYEAISSDKLEMIERQVNEWILANTPVKTYQMALKDVPSSGITALFDEKYGEIVRVVDIGGYSRELCGGTHAQSTGELGLFRIVAESSVASGVRRIEALTGWAALDWTRREHETLRHLAHKLSSSPDEIGARVDVLIDQVKKLERERKEWKQSSALGQLDQLLSNVKPVGGVPVLVSHAGNVDNEGLRAVMDQLRAKLPDAVILISGTNDDKVAFICSAPEAAVAKGIHCGKIIGPVAKEAGGGGGGKPNKAEAGGRQPDNVEAALATGRALIEAALAG